MRSDEPRGVILIVVLWAIAMMTVVIGALTTNVRMSLDLAGTETRRLKSQMILEGGIDVAAATIIASGDRARMITDGRITRIDLGQGVKADMAIREAGGLVDINRADAEFLANVIGRAVGSAEEGKAIAETITTWRAGEVEAAEDTEPAAFISLAQLYTLKGIERAAVNKMIPFVSLYSIEGAVNAASAPKEVLASIPEITEAEIATILGARSSGNWESEEVEDVLDNLEDYLIIDSTNIYIVGLRLVEGANVIRGSELEATIRIDKSADIPFHVLARSW
jgi:type II secretory pathway component PulK